MNEIDSLIEEVRQVAYKLHVYLGTGLLEKVYENGLKHRFLQVRVPSCAFKLLPITRSLRLTVLSHA